MYGKVRKMPPYSQSMRLIFQLDADVWRNPSKGQDLCRRTTTFIDPIFERWIFFRKSVGLCRAQQYLRQVEGGLHVLIFKHRSFLLSSLINSVVNVRVFYDVYKSTKICEDTDV